MKKYGVAIEELLTRVITVEAESEADAYEKVWEKYTDGHIVLDFSDYVDGDINVLGEIK